MGSTTTVRAREGTTPVPSQGQRGTQRSRNSTVGANNKVTTRCHWRPGCFNCSTEREVVTYRTVPFTRNLPTQVVYYPGSRCAGGRSIRTTPDHSQVLVPASGEERPKRPWSLQVTNRQGTYLHSKVTTSMHVCTVPQAATSVGSTEKCFVVYA